MSTKKQVAKKAPRKNLNKDEINAQIEQQSKNEHMKDVVRKIYPSLGNLDSVYDAGTSLQAISGYIAQEIKKRSLVLSISNLSLDLSKEPEGKVKDAMLEIVELIKDEPAEEVANTLQRLAGALEGYKAFYAMKEPIDTVKLDQILA